MGIDNIKILEMFLGKLIELLKIIVMISLNIKVSRNMGFEVYYLANENEFADDPFMKM